MFHFKSLSDTKPTDVLRILANTKEQDKKILFYISENIENVSIQCTVCQPLPPLVLLLALLVAEVALIIL